jgi:glycosyltransferase involved in cell wall biosynthesis
MRRAKSNRVALVLGARHDFWLDQRVLRTARALAAATYEVLAYTPVESKVHEHHIEGVTARYVSAPGATNRLFKRLFFDYLLYNIPAAIDMIRNKVDICHCNDFDTLPSGVLLKVFSFVRAKLVYDSHEDYPLFIAWGHGKLLAKVIAIAEAILTRFFVNIAITTTEGVKARFEKLNVRCEVIFNCQDLLDTNSALEEPIIGDKNKEFWIAYQGGIKKSRGYEQLVEAADILVNERGICGLRFIIIGKSMPDRSYGESIEEMITNKGLADNFTFTGFMDYRMMMKIVKRADVGIIPLQPAPWYLWTLPNKLFENLVAGIPTIASNFPEMATIINQENCGLLVDATQPLEIADAIEYLYKHEDIKLEMGRNALRAAQEKYNFPKQAEKLLRVYQDLG